jgi:hypothetical protein
MDRAPVIVYARRIELRLGENGVAVPVHFSLSWLDLCPESTLAYDLFTALLPNDRPTIASADALDVTNSEGDMSKDHVEFFGARPRFAKSAANDLAIASEEMPLRRSFSMSSFLLASTSSRSGV